MIDAIPFRIRVGMTGHRALADPERIRKRVREVLDGGFGDFFDPDSQRILREAKHTPVRLTAVTSLAEGADRLIAQEIGGLPDSRITAVLPLPVAEYSRDFETSESQAEFSSLLAHSRSPILIHQQLSEVDGEGGGSGQARQQAYADAGAYMIDHCDVLIAVWDGRPARGQGGTAEVVALAERRKRPLLIIPADGEGDIVVKPGHGLSAKSIPALELFNGFRAGGRAEIEQTDETYNEIFTGAAAAAVPAERKELIRTKLLPYVVRAFLLAERNKKRYLRAGLLVYTLSALAVSAVASGILLPRLSGFAFGLEFLCLSAILAIVTFAHRRRRHKNWIECRFLSERLYSGIYFAACGLDPEPITILPCLGLAHQPDDWMILAFDEIWNRLPAWGGAAGLPCLALASLVRRRWIRREIAYHSRNADKKGRASRILESAGQIVFLTALIAVGAHLAFFAFQSHSLRPESLARGVESILTFLALALPGVGAAIGGIRTHREYSRLAKRSLNMDILLRNLDERYSLVLRPAELVALLRDTETLLLRETQEWLSLMRFVSLKAV